MAFAIPSGPSGQFRGKLAKMVYARQADGRITVRGVGEHTGPSTAGEQKGQHRMKLGHSYVRAVLDNPALRSVYADEAQRRKKRTCDLVMSDFLTNPVVSSVDAVKYNGLAGGWLLIMTGDDFKVIRVGVVLRNAAGRRLEEGFAVPAQGSTARVWLYTAQANLESGQALTIEITATDRPCHSTVIRVTHAI